MPTRAFWGQCAGMGMLGMLKKLLQDGCTIKVIGDSLAAGAGSSGITETEEIIFQDPVGAYYRREAPNSWWALLDRYIKKNYPRSGVRSLGCGGAFSFQIREQLPGLVSPEDKAVFLLLGLNDRKRPEGMGELAHNIPALLDRLAKMGKYAELFTPTPSTEENEHFPNRLYHTPQVVGTLRRAAGEAGVPLVDLHRDIESYLQASGKKLEDIIFGVGCQNDGLHPGDAMQKIMFESVVRTLGI